MRHIDNFHRYLFKAQHQRGRPAVMAVDQHIAVRFHFFNDHRLIEHIQAMLLIKADLFCVFCDDPVIGPDFFITEYILRIGVQF